MTLEQSILSLIDPLTEVKEAFLSQSSHCDGVQAVLGLLCTELSADARFKLMQEIGDLATVHFGEAGAIVVYDDMSSNWTLFESMTPFYVRERTQ